MAHYTLFVGKNDKFYHHLQAGNNEIILQSKGFDTKEEALQNVSLVQINSQIAERFNRLSSNDNKPYFTLCDEQGEIIGWSETYNSNQAMEVGIASVMKNGSIKRIDDETKPKGFRIIVNGSPKPWKEKKISFKEIILLAYGEFIDKPTMVYTVAYEDGPKQNPEGSMAKGTEVFVKNKMIFHATATDKS